jgi:hypothetical protein
MISSLTATSNGTQKTTTIEVDFGMIEQSKEQLLWQVLCA